MGTPDTKELHRIVALLRSYGFSDPSDLLDVLFRVLQTRQALPSGASHSGEIWRTMEARTPSLPRFSGDADLFCSLYRSLAPIDGRGILTYLLLSGGSREIALPEALIQTFARHITERTRSVLIPECEQYGPSLLDIIRSCPKVRFTLICRQSRNAELIAAALPAGSNAAVETADICSYGFTARKFDLILCVPPFGSRVLVDNTDFISREPDLIAAQNLLYHLNLDGELVIVLPAKITFAGGSTASLREYIETNYKIKEIAALPAGLFVPYSAIRTYLFVFSTGTTDDVVLKQYEPDRPIRRASACQQLLVTQELLLFSDEFSALSGWNIDMAFSEEDEDMRAFHASPVKKLRLKDAASVFRGKAVTGKADRGNISVINLSDLTETGIDYARLDLMQEEAHKVARYALAEGDVLVSARGTTIKTAVFHTQPSVCIPSANINVIRPKEGLRGEYLKLFLDSPVGGKLLQSLQRGSAAVNINYRDLMELEIPILPPEAQEALIQEYNTGLRFYRDTIAAAEEGWQGVQRDIQSKLY